MKIVFMQVLEGEQRRDRYCIRAHRAVPVAAHDCSARASRGWNIAAVPVFSLRAQCPAFDREYAMRASKSVFCALALSLAFIATSLAQQPGRIRGRIETMDGPNAVLKLRDGSTMKVKIADDVRVSALTKASLDDLKNDTFVGIAGVARPDGSIEAYSVHIFLPAQRGVVPDRHGPWDGRPNSTMTNAYIEGTPTGTGDTHSFKVKYKDGEKNIIVTPQTSIARAAPGSKDELKPGAQIIIFASEKQGDITVAKVMYVGRGIT